MRLLQVYHGDRNGAILNVARGDIRTGLEPLTDEYGPDFVDGVGTVGDASFMARMHSKSGNQARPEFPRLALPTLAPASHLFK